MVSRLDLSTRDPSAMLEAIRQAQARFIVGTMPHESFGDLLTTLLSITESEYGFVGEVFSNNGVTPYLKTHAITNIAWNDETRALYDKYSAEKGMEFHNLKTLFGQVLVTGKLVIANDLANDPRAGGLPHGHPTMRSFMGLPFSFSGKMIGMIGVANRPHGYTIELFDWLKPLLDTCATLIVGYQNSRDRRQAEHALRESEERFRNLVEGSIQGIYIHQDFKPLFANQAFANILGYNSTDELLSSMESIEEHHAPHEWTRIRGYKEARLRGEEAPSQYEYAALRKDGSIITLQNSVRVIHWEGKPAIQSTVIDVTEARSLSEQLSYQASHDALTDLFNRRVFEQRLQQLLARAQAEKTEHVLCYLDLDQFKVINDSCGHTAGDELLRQMGRVLQEQVRNRDMLARLGGDEFGILLERCSAKRATRVTTAVLAAVEDFRFAWEEQSFSIGVSIGVVPINEASGSAADVLSMADVACYAAKDAGRNRAHIYREDDVELAKRRGEMHWVAVINRALEENRFLLHCQPFTPLASGNDQRQGYELLVRMQDETGSLVVPGAFLPAAERYHLSTKVDRWVVSTAFEWFSRHRDNLERALVFSINLSGSSLSDNEFLEFIVKQLKEKNLPPEKICFEVTETTAIANLTHATQFIKALKELGCRFALDDFGSGLSSFAYLKNLPVDFIKIDGMFVKDIIENPIDFAIVKSINDMGHVMGKQTIAEFVENDAILEKLREVGIDYAQGYGIGWPRPIEEMTKDSKIELINATAGP